MMDYIHRQRLSDAVVMIISCYSMTGDSPFSSSGDLGLVIHKKVRPQSVERCLRHSVDLHRVYDLVVVAGVVVVTDCEINPFLFTTVITSS